LNLENNYLNLHKIFESMVSYKFTLKDDMCLGTHIFQYNWPIPVHFDHTIFPTGSTSVAVKYSGSESAIKITPESLKSYAEFSYKMTLSNLQWDMKVSAMKHGGQYNAYLNCHEFFTKKYDVISIIGETLPNKYFFPKYSS